MIKRKYTKPYKCRICSNKMEYSIATGPYCTTHDVMVPFCMPEFSNRKIISHLFLVDKNEGESVIVYDIIIGLDLMVQLGLLNFFEHKSFNGMMLSYR